MLWVNTHTHSHAEKVQSVSLRAAAAATEMIPKQTPFFVSKHLRRRKRGGERLLLLPDYYRES